MFYTFDKPNRGLVVSGLSWLCMPGGRGGGGLKVPAILFLSFLMPPHLYKRVCPSVHPSVHPSVTSYFQIPKMKDVNLYINDLNLNSSSPSKKLLSIVGLGFYNNNIFILYLYNICSLGSYIIIGR